MPSIDLTIAVQLLTILQYGLLQVCAINRHMLTCFYIFYITTNQICCMKPYQIKGSECQYMIYCTANISHIALWLLTRRATANTIDPPPPIPVW